MYQFFLNKIEILKFVNGLAQDLKLLFGIFSLKDCQTEIVYVY